MWIKLPPYNTFMVFLPKETISTALSFKRKPTLISVFSKSWPHVNITKIYPTISEWVPTEYAKVILVLNLNISLSLRRHCVPKTFCVASVLTICFGNLQNIVAWNILLQILYFWQYLKNLNFWTSRNKLQSLTTHRLIYIGHYLYTDLSL